MITIWILEELKKFKVAYNSCIFLKIKTLFINFHIKFIYTLPLMLLIEVSAVVYAFILLLFLDTLTGTIYSLKTGTFRSRRFREALLKLMLYFIIIFSSRLIEFTISPLLSTTKITELVILVIAITEF